MLKVLSDKILEDKEDIWFDLHKSITSQRELAESLVERQVRRMQRAEAKRLKLKKERLMEVKQGFAKRAMERQQKKVEKEAKKDNSKERSSSSPPMLNPYRIYMNYQRQA